MKLRKFLLPTAAILAAVAISLNVVPGFRFSITLCICTAALLVLFWLLMLRPTPAKRRICRILCILLLVGCIAAGITLGFVVSAAHPGEQAPCDYIVVLGAGVNGTVPSLSLRERINSAYDYLVANPKAIAVLTGGQGDREDMTEAACMYRELTKKGIDGSRLLLEERSTSTSENLTFSLDILESATGSRPQRIGIVSSEYHIFRAKCFAKDLQLEPVGIPAKTSWVSLRLNYYLREIAAVWKFLVFGS